MTATAPPEQPANEYAQARNDLQQAIAKLNGEVARFLQWAAKEPDLPERVLYVARKIDQARAAYEDVRDRLAAIVTAKKSQAVVDPLHAYKWTINRAIAEHVFLCQVRVREAPSKDGSRTNRFMEMSPDGETWGPLHNFTEPSINKRVIDAIFRNRKDAWGSWRMGQEFKLKDGVPGPVKWWAAFSARAYSEADSLEIAVCLAALREVRALDALKELAAIAPDGG